jgi:uncharacterized membrane protein YvbJ
MKCIYCGRENEESDKRCRGCGANLSIPVATGEPAIFWEAEFNKLSYRLNDVKISARNWEKTATWVAVISIIEFFIIIALVGV